MEAKRLLDVLDKQLAHHPYVAGEEYTIADMAHLAVVRQRGASQGMSMMQRSFWMPEVIKHCNAGRTGSRTSGGKRGIVQPDQRPIERTASRTP